MICFFLFFFLFVFFFFQAEDGIRDFCLSRGLGDVYKRQLKQAGAERVFLEYEHGDAVVKEQLSLLLEQAQPGDTIITLEVSRLARSTKQLCEIIDTIGQKRLCLVIVGSITMDCRNGHADPMTEAFLQMAGVFSQLELAMIRARVRSGMANARACLLYTSPSPRDRQKSRMPSSA